MEHNSKLKDKKQNRSTEYVRLSSKLEDYIKKQKDYIEYLEDCLSHFYYTNSEKYYKLQRKNQKNRPSRNKRRTIFQVLNKIKDMKHISPKTRQSLKETSNKIDEIKKSKAICVKEDWVGEEQRTNFFIQGAASCAIAAFDVAKSTRKKSGTVSRNLGIL